MLLPQHLIGLLLIENNTKMPTVTISEFVSCVIKEEKKEDGEDESGDENEEFRDYDNLTPKNYIDSAIYQFST